MKTFSFLFLLLCSTRAFGQEEPGDSSRTLQHVIVRAFEQNRKLMQVPASVVVISNSRLSSFNNTTILPALNSFPGIKMEERSPGSYRLNIRGSTLRSPFGVRNVKVYYNEIPYTDPGGNTYLNQLGYYNFQSMEIIKGPGSSLYGAGTGGAVLIKTRQEDWQPGLRFDFSAGSYRMNNLNTNLRLGTKALNHTLNYQQIFSDGYRDHTELDRKVFTWDLQALVSDKGKINAHFLWGDLFYETPGGLTKTEFRSNPRASRPRVGQTPGAIENKAAIYQELFLAGISFHQQLGENWENITSFYAAANRLRNPTTRNYGRTNEPHSGGRSLLRYNTRLGHHSRLVSTAGVEFQQGNSSVRIYSNKNGNPDTLQTDDEINNRIFFAFAQATLELPRSWIITAGVSVNAQHISIIRLSTAPVTEQKRKYNNELAPRIAVLKQVTQNFSFFGSVSKGFSPPTTAELLPSSGIISTYLEAERGINMEAGIRATAFSGRVYADITAFRFRLKNTIVQRRDQTGADFFDNAGSTSQKGVETFISWQVIDHTARPINHLRFWISHTWHHFSYKEFKQLNNDFSGNKLPGIPPHIISGGAEVASRHGIYIHVSYYYNEAAPLNDANTEKSSPFHLAGVRSGWKKNLHAKVLMELFAHADNLFNQRYSLGYDINAFGGRFYNAAAGINFAGGISLHFKFK